MGPIRPISPILKNQFFAKPQSKKTMTNVHSGLKEFEHVNDSMAAICHLRVVIIDQRQPICCRPGP